MPGSRADGSRSIRSGGVWATCNPSWPDWKPIRGRASTALFRVKAAVAQAASPGDQRYASHEEWLADWRGARSGEFFVLGSRDETGGCQLCVAAIADDGSLALRLRIACQGSMANIW